MKLKVLIHTSELPDRRCRAEVPVLPGCVSEGDTPEEALANIREAIASYFDTSNPPRGGGDQVEEIELSVRSDEPLEPPGELLQGDTAARSSPSLLRRFFMQHGRHESAAVMSLTVGLFFALFCGGVGLLPMWLGFLIGYLTTVSFAALVLTVTP